MEGGHLTSAILTRASIPVVYTYWRQEQVLWERLEVLDPPRLASLRGREQVLATGWALLATIAVAAAYAELPRAAWVAAILAASALLVGGSAAYLRARPAARRLVWPASGGARQRAA
jgi:copper/silver efflux system protein